MLDLKKFQYYKEQRVLQQNDKENTDKGSYTQNLYWFIPLIRG